MKYYWPLVVIGATLLIISPALPWVRWDSSWMSPLGQPPSPFGPLPSLGEPTSGYFTGFQHRGLTSAVGGGILLLIAVLARGEPGSRNYALVVSALCGFVTPPAGILGPICGDCPTESLAFGFYVSLLGAVLAIIGSLIWLPDADMLMTKIDVVILMVIESFIVCAGVALVAYPVLGDWLGFWRTSLPLMPCPLGRTAQCLATATAQAIQLTPPAWWPLGH